MFHPDVARARGSALATDSPAAPGPAPRPAAAALWGLLLLALPAVAPAQDQAVYYDGLGQYADFQLPGEAMATGTIELWLRPDKNFRTPGERLLDLPTPSPRQSILDLTSSRCAGPPLVVYLDYAPTEPQLGLVVGGTDLGGLLPFPVDDGQWHYVALTYTPQRVAVHLDGEKRTETEAAWGRPRAGGEKNGCLLAGSPADNSYFRGAVDNLAFWSSVRTPAELRADMASFPVPANDAAGLVARFNFDEGRGTTFRATRRSITGSLRNTPQWTRPIDAAPTLLSAGIWFVIQNKADLDTDLALEPRGTGLRTNGERSLPSLATIPLTGDYDAFLWRAVASPEGGNPSPYRLINKASGESLVIDCGARLQKTGNVAGQDFLPVNAPAAGTNAFALTRGCKPRARALSIAGGRLATPEVAAGDSQQIWLFQPMALVAGYHLPAAAPVEYPYTRVLELPRSFKLRASNTASDWAVLNAHNVYANMFNAFADKRLKLRRDGPNGDLSRRVINLISEHDEMPCRHPNTWEDCATLNDWRGYGGTATSASTLITEELMCRTGVYSRSFRDLPYSEFDQVVHEFAHTLNFQLFDPDDSVITPYAVAQGWAEEGNKHEWFPIYVQRWFNSSPSYGFHRTMLEPLEEPGKHQATESFLARYFDAANSWAPPRRLRVVSADRPYRFVISDTLIKKLDADGSHVIWSDDGESMMFLRRQGDLVVTAKDGSTVRWSSARNLGVASRGVKGVWYRDGELFFLATDDRPTVDQIANLLNTMPKARDRRILARVRVHDAGRQSSRLVVGDAGDAPQVLDVDGAVLWAGQRPSRRG